MHGKSHQRTSQEDAIASSCAVAGANAAQPNIVAQVVTDPTIIDEGRLYAEAINQTRPIATPGANSLRIAEIVRDGTARPNGLTQAAAERMATSGRSLDSFINGAIPGG